MSQVSQELAQKALEVEAVNVLKKLKDGKPITNAERALIQSIAAGENPANARGWAKTKVELANALGVSRMTLDRWLKLKRNGPPGAEPNGTWNVVEWKQWMKETGRGGGLDVDSADDELPRLNAKRLLLINERLELDNQERRGELISRDDVTKESAEIATALRSALYGNAAVVCGEVMKLTNLDEAVAIYNAAMDRALLAITTGLKAAKKRKRNTDTEPQTEQSSENGPDL